MEWKKDALCLDAAASWVSYTNAKRETLWSRVACDCVLIGYLVNTQFVWLTIYGCSSLTDIILIQLKIILDKPRSTSEFQKIRINHDWRALATNKHAFDRWDDSGQRRNTTNLGRHVTKAKHFAPCKRNTWHAQTQTNSTFLNSIRSSQSHMSKLQQAIVLTSQ